MAKPERGKSTVGTAKVPRTQSTSSTADAAMSYKQKADNMRAAKLDNASPKPITEGEKIPWARLVNTDRPMGNWR